MSTSKGHCHGRSMTSYFEGILLLISEMPNSAAVRVSATCTRKESHAKSSKYRLKKYYCHIQVPVSKLLAILVSHILDIGTPDFMLHMNKIFDKHVIDTFCQEHGLYVVTIPRPE